MTSLLILPTPIYSADLTPSLLLDTVFPSSTVDSVTAVNVLSLQNDTATTVPVSINFRPDGLLLYLRHAHYESGGPTCLAHWIARSVGGNGGNETSGAMSMETFRSLVVELQEGDSRIDTDDVEMDPER